MAASSAAPVPYFSVLFIKVLATTYKSYQVSASGLGKHACLLTVSEWERGGSAEEETEPQQAVDPHRCVRLLCASTKT